MLEQPAFGNRLRALRLERGLSQSALAEGGLSTGYLSRLESGMRAPTSRVVSHVAKKLNVPETAFDEAYPVSSLSEALAKAVSAGDGEDVAELLTHALHTDDNRDPALRWQALWQLSSWHAAHGDRSEESALLIELAGISDRIGSRDLGARTRVRLARSALSMADVGRAREHAQEAYRLSAGLSAADRADALHVLVAAEAEAGRLTDARAHATELVGIAHPLGGVAGAKAQWALATVCIRQADHRAAQDALDEALKALDSHTDLPLWIRLRLAAASLYLQITPPLVDRARVVLDELEPAVELVGTEADREEIRTVQAHFAFADGRIADARRLSDRIEGDPSTLPLRDRIRFQALRSKLLIIDGKFDEGTRELQRFAEEAQASRDMELAAEIWRDLAETLAGTYGPGKG